MNVWVGEDACLHTDINIYLIWVESWILHTSVKNQSDSRLAHKNEHRWAELCDLKITRTNGDNKGAEKKDK